MDRKHVVTIGYEGAELRDFLATLAQAGVRLLLDVREIPLSRRKGYSKRALSDALATAGIAYQHERALGSPKAVRHQLRADGDFRRYFRAFDAHLATQSALLDALAAQLPGPVALMCFERDWRECHRSVVAAALAERRNASVQHLEVTPDAAQQRRAHARADSRQGLPAA